MGGITAMMRLAAVMGVLVVSCGVLGDNTLPAVSGEFGVRPIIRIPGEKPDAVPRVAVLSNGSGRVTMPDDVVLADVEIRQWAGNRPYLNTYDANRPTTVVLDGQHVSDAWREALVGHPAGSRVLLVGPASQAFGPDGAPAAVSPAETLVVVFDILGGYPPDARLVGGYPPDARLVGRTLPDLPASFGTDSSRTLIGGSGPVVDPGSKIVVQYVGALLPSRHVFDSSHHRGGPSAFTLVPRAVPPGWIQALTGRRVGSRVALTVPASATRAGTIPHGALLYVVDVIDKLT